MMIKGFWFTIVVFFIVAYFLAGCAGDVKPESENTKAITIAECGPTPVGHRDKLHKVLVQTNPPYLTWEDVKESQREQFIAAFNASPPPSNVSSDAAIRLYSRYDSLSFFVVLSDPKGCIISTLQVPRGQVLLWLYGRPSVPRSMKKSKSRI